MVRKLEREAGPHQDHEGDRQQRVLQPFETEHTELRLTRRGYRATGCPAQPQPVQFACPVTRIVQQHQTNGDWNRPEIESPHPTHRRRFTSCLREVYWPYGEPFSSSWMAAAACGCEVFSTNRRARIG